MSAAALQAEKSALRTKMRSLRNALTAGEVHAAGERITRHILELPAFSEAGTLFTYLDVHNEVPTRSLIKTALQRQMNVYAPISSGDQMQWAPLESLKNLTPGRYGIPGPPVPATHHPLPGERSIALVPGLAFTPQGARLGQGGGHFDRFLKDFPGLSIGLAHDRQLLDHLPQEPHDIRVQHVVTPRAIHAATPYRFDSPTP